jgi:predicted AlkP superfamily pyrophosphatase or phosphodiesterase
MRLASTISASLFGCILLLSSLNATAQPRVILASFDGLGQQILEDDPAGKELVNLRVLLRRGRVSRGVQPAFPSTTANSHAAIWTGAYGNRNGVSGNWNPVLPRAEHTFLERRIGFRSESLIAEPLWVSAARQGVSVVAHQVTQVYPFTAASAGLDLPNPPVVLNSYQTRKAADYRVLRAADVESLPAIGWDPPLRASALPARHFTWDAGPVRYVASLVAGQGSQVYDSMVIAERPDGPRVEVPLVPTEQEWARGRTLARHFSAPLPMAGTPDTAGFGPLAAVFRLWETTADGDFLLLAMPLQELGFAHGAASQATVAAELVREAGPLVGNGPSTPYLSGRLGAPVYQGGDGRAELRYLECMEFIARQYNRYTEWLWTRYQPRFLLDYFPFPDEMDHGWLGLSRETGVAAEARALRYQEFRRRGYQIVDQRIGLLRQLAERDKVILAITSDHGMASVVKNVNINAALREVGYLALDDNEQIDAKRTRATGDYAILLNTEDWKGGIIPLSQKQEVLRDLAARLGQIKDPETGTPVFAGFYTEAEHGNRFGIGGPSGFDLYFDLAPGYAPERKHVGPAVEALDVPRGRHGFQPAREDMRAIFVAWGKGIGRGYYGRMRSTQIAPTVSGWLKLKPPASAKDRRASTFNPATDPVFRQIHRQ